jgi:hypothetical protein
LLAKFLLGQPAWIQATVLGLSTGLFATAAAQANERDPTIDATVLMVLFWGACAAVLYYLGIKMQSRRGAAAEHTAPPWLYTLYSVIWLSGLAAATLALVGEGGFKVAVLAVVPLVLLAPAAFYGVRHFTHRATT